MVRPALAKDIAIPIRWTTASFAALSLVIASTVHAQDLDGPTNKVRLSIGSNGLVKTPPMGWNSWNKFGCNIGEDMVRGEAEAMVSSGMKAAGYEYVVIDDCWQGPRDSNGNITADPVRFPTGIKALADRIHALGLKFGLYSDAGIATCAGRPGSRGYEYQDARQYAAWGVDYLKYDWCNTSGQDPRSSYELMAHALQSTGRPIIFSICEWGAHQPWEWARGAGGNTWRTTGDISDEWKHVGPAYGNGVVDILDRQVGLEGAAGPGGWNDPDMLQVGNGGMTDVEYRSHFSLWAMLAAPLMAGNDLRNMSPATSSILANRDVIAVNQDPLGQQARRIARDGDLEVWSKQLEDGGRAVVLLNRGVSARTITVRWPQLGYPGSLKAFVRDLWAHADLGRYAGSLSRQVPPHGVVMLSLTTDSR